jgi:ABC-type Fe3+ transport system substrate-binding protein
MNIVRTGLAACAALLLAATAHAAELSPAMKQLVADATPDGEIDLAWSAGTLGGAQGADLFEQGINAMFGTSLHIKFTPAPSMAATANQLAMRDAAQQPSQTDVYLGFSRDYAEIINRNLFLAANWQELLPGRIPDGVTERGNTLVKTQTALLGVTYNTAAAPAKPVSLYDFLKPEWKGKFATTPYTAGFDILASAQFLGPERALDFARQLAPQVGGLIRCDGYEDIASGLYDALMLDCDGSGVGRLIKKGAPLSHVTLKDFPAMSYFYFAVPKRAPHPAAGKLFVAFSMTSEGQKIVRDTWDWDLHLYPDSMMRKVVADAEAADGRKLQSLDIDWQMGNEKGRDTWREINRMLAVKK